MRSNLTIALLTSLLVLSACDYMPSWMGGKKPEITRLPGERITVLPGSIDSQPDDALKILPVSLPPAVENPDWPQHTGIINSASSNLVVKGNLESSESASVGEGEAFQHTLIPRPVVGGGMVFAMDADGKISAHDVANIGSVKWVANGTYVEDMDNIGGGLAYDQGKLYVVGGNGVAVAIDTATGKELWKKSHGIPFRSAPKVMGDKLFAITIDSQLFAINTPAGDVAWTHRGIDETAGLMNSVSPSVAGDTVIVPYSSGELYSIASFDGRELWNTLLSLNKRTQASAIFSGIGGDPVVDNEVVFAVSSSGALAVFSTVQGQKIWDRPFSSVNTPWVAGDFLFMLTTDDTLICMVKYDGRIRWSTQLDSFEDMQGKRRPISWRGPILVNGKLAVVGSRGKMLLVDSAEGKIASTIEIPDEVYTAPVIAGGRMYLINKDAKLTVLK
jgi:outer membrane protein assembly factor BamB